MFIPLIFFVLPLLLLWPDKVFAWGPATHLQLGWQVLSNPALLIAPVKPLLEVFPYDYLYGCISADIVVGKRFTRELKHCHNWRVGFKLLNSAVSPSQKAFAYGYLSHLAADTIAHNYYVPEKMVSAYSTRFLRHVYWEMRFDALAEKVVWDLPRKIMKDVHEDNDPLLESVLENTLLSFSTNKTIFNNVMLIHRMEQWHKMIGKLSSYSRWVLHKEDVDIYYQNALKAVLDVLQRQETAACIKEDPTGRKNLDMAKSLRKKLKFMKRNGIGTTIVPPVFPFREVSHQSAEIRKNRA